MENACEFCEFSPSLALRTGSLCTGLNGGNSSGKSRRWCCKMGDYGPMKIRDVDMTKRKRRN